MSLLGVARTGILVLAALPLVAGLALEWRLRDEARIARAERDLLRNRLEAAAASYAGLRGSFWVGERVDAAIAVLGTLHPGLVSGLTDPAAAVDFPALNGRVLLTRALSSSDFEACLRLAEALQRVEAPFARLFHVSALLELYGPSHARTAFSELGADLRARPLGLRIEHALKELAVSDGPLLFDRNGLPIGHLGDRGNLRLSAPVNPALVPIAAYEEQSLASYSTGLRLSLDLKLADLAREALAGYRGSIVLIEPQTGEILAAVSDPLSVQTESLPAFRQLREPASISKVLTTTAALRAGLNPDLVIAGVDCSGARRYGSGILYCPCRSGRLSGLTQALAVSCNLAFADLGVQVGRDRLLSEMRLFGLDRPEEQGIPFGRILKPKGDQRQLADLSIGLEETAITPLHAALIAASIANGGSLAAPRLTHAMDGWLGVSPQTVPLEQAERILDPSWLPLLRSAMEAVTGPGGSAFGVVPFGLRFGMKTGTAADGRTGYHTNYIGFGPLPEPKVAFCVRVTHQRTSSRVRRATLEVTRRLLHGLAESSVAGSP